jgi:hypothetical protein
MFGQPRELVNSQPRLTQMSRTGSVAERDSASLPCLRSGGFIEREQRGRGALVIA